MAWGCPKYSRGEVDRAGDVLIRPTASTPEYENALRVMNNWRSSHSYPLQALKMALVGRSKKLDPSVVVAQRLKRLSSVTAKLQRYPHMKLSQMQDIAGCRAVLPTMQMVDELVDAYQVSYAENPTSRSEFVKKFDYVVAPKENGYRSIHLIYRYKNRSENNQVYNGLRVEIQIRTRLQHAWATAVETVSTFTGQALKANGGTDQWKRFFVLMGNAMARRERGKIAQGTFKSRLDSVRELRSLSKKLDAETALLGWNTALKITETGSYAKAHVFLLVLDTKKLTVGVEGFGRKEVPRATEIYLNAEKENQRFSERQTVLVSVDSIDALRTAYPNYYMNTTEFLDAVRKATSLRAVLRP